MNTPSLIRDELRVRAAHKATAPELARWLQGCLAPDFSAFDFVRYFMEAFGIPLAILRDAESWRGFTEAGTLDDCALDQLLRPWLDL